VSHLLVVFNSRHYDLCQPTAPRQRQLW